MPESTVNYHIRNHKKEGIKGLIIKKQPGQSKKMTDEQEKKLVEIVSTMTPEEAGIGIFANWTSPLICELVKRLFGIQYTSRGMRKVLNRLGLSYTRPTYTLEKADKKKQEEFQKEEEMLKKNC
jgi:putative transposase